MREQAQSQDTATHRLVTAQHGRRGGDREVANLLLRAQKPVVLCVNKMDSTGLPDPGIYEFYSLGLGDPIAVSAIHGHGTGDLLDQCVENFPPEGEG
jgi:GTP-binding protein